MEVDSIIQLRQLKPLAFMDHWFTMRAYDWLRQLKPLAFVDHWFTMRADDWLSHWHS